MDPANMAIPMSLGMARTQIPIIRSGTRIVVIRSTVDNHDLSLGSNPEWENLRTRSDVSGNADMKERVRINDHRISIQSKGA
jgi:hypothetical protein